MADRVESEAMPRSSSQHTRRRLVVALATGAVALAGGGCGSEAQVSGLSEVARSRLVSHLETTRRAVDRRDRAGAGRALSAFTAEVTRLARSDGVDPLTARALLAGAARARRRLALELRAPGPPEAVTPSPAPSATPLVPAPPARGGPSTDRAGKQRAKRDGDERRHGKKKEKGGGGKD